MVLSSPPIRYDVIADDFEVLPISLSVYGHSTVRIIINHDILHHRQTLYGTPSGLFAGPKATTQSVRAIRGRRS